jgi:methionine-S-sulfoxide reductase
VNAEQSRKIHCRSSENERILKILEVLMKPLMMIIVSFLSSVVFAAASTTANPVKKSAEASAKLETATLAAGCFWGVEEHFRKIPGVIETKVGYSGGTTANPKYEQMHDGKTGHAETVEIKFDPSKVTFNTLLDHFFKMHDPTTLNKQGNDVGVQYRSAIFVHGEKQKAEAIAFKAKVEKSKAWKKPIVTEITDAKTFWDAEPMHQKYLVKNPGAYDNHFVRKISFDK